MRWPGERPPCYAAPCLPAVGCSAALAGGSPPWPSPQRDQTRCTRRTRLQEARGGGRAGTHRREGSSLRRGGTGVKRARLQLRPVCRFFSQMRAPQQGCSEGCSAGLLLSPAGWADMAGGRPRERASLRCVAVGGAAVGRRRTLVTRCIAAGCIPAPLPHPNLQHVQQAGGARAVRTWGRDWCRALSVGPETAAQLVQRVVRGLCRALGGAVGAPKAGCIRSRCRTSERRSAALCPLPAPALN